MTLEMLTPILLTIIAFFLIRYINRSDKRVDYFSDKIDELTKNITTVIANYNNQNKTCADKHVVINKVFDEHEHSIKDHEIRIVKLEKK